MKPWLAALLLAGWASVQAAEPILESAEIVPVKEVPFSSQTLIPLKSEGIAEVDLEVGDSLNSLVLRIHSKPGVKADFSVDHSFETSLTVMEEGPHLDLVDWKHYVSPWQPLEKLSATEFRIRPITEAESQKFPKVTPKEIQAIVTERGGPALGKYVSKVKGPNDYPCGVGVSKINLRIKVKEDGKEKVLKTIAFFVPMGC